MKAKPTPLVALVDRAIAETRQGGLVMIRDGHSLPLAVTSAELTSAATLAHMAQVSMQPLRVAVTTRRARALGLTIPANAGETVLLTLTGSDDLAVIRWLADPLAATARPPGLPDALILPATLNGLAFEAAIALMKLAQLLPAAVIASVPPRAAILRLSARQILSYHAESAYTLTHVGEARVPLRNAENTRIVAFRPTDGGAEHLAIVIGEPDLTQPVLIRLHSECFTGDLLGSLRCDCGDQLRGAIAEISAAGSGVLLYLAQEGRGIGLINKLRSYRLQDQGFDTMEANSQLGYDNDERIYQTAAHMLSLLGVDQVRLMTNNPHKIESMGQFGINVVQRVPHIFPSNNHNVDYLATKAAKGGHLF